MAMPTRLFRNCVLHVLLIVVCLGKAGALELITAGYESKPKYYYLESGEVGGLCVDIIRAVEKSDPTVRITGYERLQYTSFERVKLDLKSGKIDVYFGFSRNKQREATYRYVEVPLYPMEFVIAARHDDMTAISSYDDIRRLGPGIDGTLLTVKGTAAARHIQSQRGLTVDDGVREIQTNLKKLVSGRGRFVFFNRLELTSAIRDEKLNHRVKLLPTTFYRYYQYAAFSKQVPLEDVSRIREALERLNAEGKLTEIYTRYITIE